MYSLTLTPTFFTPTLTPPSSTLALTPTSSTPTPLGAGRGEFHDPPLIYNLEFDPSEDWPLAPSSAEYQVARAAIEAANRSHQRTLRAVPNQMLRGTDPDLKICCNPHSQRTLPHYPNCTCNPENFDGVFVCAPVGPAAALLDPQDASTWPHLPRMQFQHA